MILAPPQIRATRGRRWAAATADGLATQAAMATFTRGGNAVDAAIAANAAIAVTGPHMCGMGGDLFALVATPAGDVVGLNASGRAGSGADPAALRAAGLTEMPMRHDVRSVTVPGCVDGWIALHARFGAIGLDEVLGPAIGLAADGFPASPLLVRALGMVDDLARAQLAELAAQATHGGATVRRPGVAAALEAIPNDGRDGFYGGAFGAGLLALGDGLFTADDLSADQADWVAPLALDVFGVELSTIPPNSQGYLALGIAGLGEAAGLPDDWADPQWAHLLVEAATAASFDRPDVLHDGADGPAILDAVLRRGELIDHGAASRRMTAAGAGDTTYLCTADGDGWAVSLIESNASGFGSWLVEPNTGINVHNRGIGFSLLAGHPAQFGPGRRPPHTLLPALARRDGRVAAVFGTMGGDAQPQIVAQLAARLFAHGQPATVAVEAPRWVLRGPVTGFDTWTAPSPPTVVVEDHAPEAWANGLVERGHDVDVQSGLFGGFGHAHAITVGPDGVLSAAADPRCVIGSAAAL